MSRVSNSRKVQQRQLNQSIAETARQLVELVREHIDARGRVSSDLIARIVIDHNYVALSFIDYPDEYADVIAWN